MKLEVGEYYLNAIGEIIQIDCISPFFNIFYDRNDNEYNQDGRYDKGCTQLDLIAHIPKKLHKHILNEINSYHTDIDFRKVVDNVWSDK